MIAQIKCCHKLLQILRSSFTFQYCTHMAFKDDDDTLVYT